MPRLASVTGGFAGFASLGISLAPPAAGGESIVGILYASGSTNTYGSLGDDSVTGKNSPVQIGSLSWKKISAGQNHALALRSDDLLFGWGDNRKGAVGDSTFVSRSSPVQIGSSNWTDISAGESHSMAVRSDGLLFGWGSNSKGELAQGFDFDMTNATSWKSLALGAGFTLGIRSNGSLWAWGTNSYGQLGNNNTAESTSPVQIGTSSWTMVAADASTYTSYAIKADGTLWFWGQSWNGSGGIGLSGDVRRSSPVQIGSSNNWSFVTAGQNNTGGGINGGNLYMWGNNYGGAVDGWNYNVSTSRSTPWQIGTSGTNNGLVGGWTRVSIAGGGFAIGIRYGYLYAWGGFNNYGEHGRNFSGTAGGTAIGPAIGSNNDWSDVTVTNGATGVAAIRNNLLFTWGYGNNGQLGQNSTASKSSPTQVGSAVWRRVYGGASHIRAIDFLDYQWILGGSITDLAGGDSSKFPKLSPTAYTYYNLSSPVQVGSRKWKSLLPLNSVSQFGIDSKDRAYYWGYGSNAYYPSQPNISFSDPTPLDAKGNFESPQQVGRTVAATTFTSAAGDFQGFNGSVGSSGVLSIYGTSVSMNTRFSQIRTGDTFTIVYSGGTATLTFAGEGTYDDGGGEGGYWLIPIVETGLSYNAFTSFTFDAISPQSWTAVSASKSGNNTLAIRSDGTLWSWGSNVDGQTTLPASFSTVPFPKQVSASSWKNVSANNNRAYAIRNDDLLFGWGKNSGLLGDGTSTNRSSPVQIGSGSWKQVSAGTSHTVGVASDNALYGWGGYAANQINLIEFKQIHAGSIYAYSDTWASDAGFVGVSSQNKLYAIGWAADQFGVPRSLVSQIGTDSDWDKAYFGRYYHTMVLKTNGTLWSAGWGSTNGRAVDSVSTLGQIGADTWSAVAVGSADTNSSQTLAIKSNGTLWHWGDQYATPHPGDGLAARSTPTQVGTATNWTKVAAHGRAAFAINSAGQLWGYANVNSFGQLGSGTTASQPTLLQIGSGTNWNTVAAGATHTLAIKNDGTLWAWGNNSSGELGVGDTVHRSSPVQVGSRTDWAKVFAGLATSFAIDSSGKLWSWGSNTAYKLGHFDDPYGTKSVPTQVGSENWDSVAPAADTTWAIKTNPGQLFVWGDNWGKYGNGTTASATSQVGTGLDTSIVYNSPVAVTGSSGLSWKNVSAGNNITLATTSTNALYAWGDNTGGFAGNGSNGLLTTVTNLNRSAAAVSAGSNVAYFLQ